MNAVGASMLAVLAALVIGLPRRWAAVPILLCAAYMTRGQVIDLAGANFTVLRLVIGAGLVRVMLRGEGIAGGVQLVDRLMVLWALLLMATSAVHTSDAWMYRAGVVWTDLGCYFLFRVFIGSSEDVYRTLRIACLCILPLAAAMAYEKQTMENLFGGLGAVNEEALVRDGQIRAAGPFAHPILAGSVGAACAAIGMVLWHRYRAAALAGLAGGLVIVYASTSSGPVLMFLAFLLAFALWPWRGAMRAVRYGLVVGAVALDLVMKDPFYFVIARIDLTGSSASYHRAQLIRSSIEHLSEWWLAGTDYTRHWMATGIHANEIHTDMTNHVLTMGVLGGLPLLLVFLLVIAASFWSVGRVLRARAGTPSAQILSWGLGALLFAFLTNFMTITLFDYSIVFLYLVLCSIQATAVDTALTEHDRTSADAVQPQPATGAQGPASPHRPLEGST